MKTNIARNLTPKPNIILNKNEWVNPGKALTRSGEIINTSNEIWTINEDYIDNQINWDLIKLSYPIKHSMKGFIFTLLESRSLGTASSSFNILKLTTENLNVFNDVAEISLEALLNIFTKEKESNTAWHFGYIRRWYKWGIDYEIPGFNVEIYRKLKHLKISAFKSGQRVLTREVNNGPFDDNEFDLIRASVKRKDIDLKDKVIVMVLLELGMRPSQAVLLNETDLKTVKVDPQDEKVLFYSLDVTRMKQVDRSQKKTRRISHELGNLIEQLIIENNNSNLTANFPAESRPLFYSRESKNDGNGNLVIRRMPRPMFNYFLGKYSENYNIISPRTKEHLNMFPYRFRYTFGVRHTNQGTPAAVIAEMLDHSGLETVQVYTKSSSNIVDNLNKSLANNPIYMDLINRFLGKVVDQPDEKSSIMGTTPTLKNVGKIGSCGANFLCKLYPPLSCYICPKFNAWKDGPHAEMLDELKTYQKNLIETSKNSSNRIPIQLNQTISAIEQLILKIETLK